MRVCDPRSLARSVRTEWAVGVKGFAATIRGSQWWEHKLAPMLGTGYATAFLVGAPLLHAWPAFLLTLGAVVPGAAYVSLINDLTDLRADRLAGKPNRLADWPRVFAVGAPALCVLTGVAIGAVAWRHYGLVLAVYGGAWLAFSLYSIPPIRLKGRGLAGVFADAAGAHLFPQLLMVVIVFRQVGSPIRASWIAVVGSWALAYGLRGALLHQLGDVIADQRSGVRTFAHLQPDGARWLGLYVLFPLEVAAFGVLLVQAHNALGLAFLPVYMLLELMLVRLWGLSIQIVSAPPHDTYRVAMHDYYMVLYPLTLLLAATLRHPRDALVLVTHLALFPRAATAMARDADRVIRQLMVRRIGVRR